MNILTAVYFLVQDFDAKVMLRMTVVCPQFHFWSTLKLFDLDQKRDFQQFEIGPKAKFEQFVCHMRRMIQILNCTKNNIPFVQ